MESQSLQFNGITWSLFRLGENAWLLKPNVENIQLEVIHEAGRLLQQASLDQISDIIPAYNSITIISKRSISTIASVLKEADESTRKKITPKPKLHKIKICYELGMDWEEMESRTKLKKEVITEIHCSKDYTVAMTGFLPGFIFLAGLDEKISVPRKELPRTSVPAGSVGIGGNQTGIYSLESPGGWQIIGRTPESFFNAEDKPPMKIQAGDKVRFISISEKEFFKVENKNG